MAKKTVVEMASDSVRSVADPFVAMGRLELVGIFIAGAVAGAVTYILYQLLNAYVFGAVLCRGTVTTDCSKAPEYALVVAAILGAVVGLIWLVRNRAYRPILIAVGTLVALWGVGTLISGLFWFWAIVALALLNGLAYVLFAWLVRPRSFVWATVLVIVAVVLARVVISL